jgi:hypothetical protein
MSTNRRTLAAIAAATLLAACAPDEFKPHPASTASSTWSGGVLPDTIGPTLVRQWAQGCGPGGGGPVSWTRPRLYYGR